MLEKEKITAEKRELDILLDKGVKIEIERPVYKRLPGITGYLKKRVRSIEKMEFTIKEPTLATLDRIASEQIELELNEDALKSDQGVSEAYRIVKANGRKMARILAYAALGQDYVKTKVDGSTTRYEYDYKKLDELTELFLHTINPPTLLKHVLTVINLSNLGDFTNSIRLMSPARTTMPIRIEQNKKD